MKDKKPIEYPGENAAVSWHGNRFALCRCGASENKPFCDGQHAKTGFTAG